MAPSRTFGLVALAAGLLAVPAVAQPPSPSSAPCPDWQSPDSSPGRQWWAANRWRYASDDQAASAYALLTGDNPSPWPDGFVPVRNELAPGTRFKMAIAPGQSPTQPGGFGTLDDLVHVEEVRLALAVKKRWKSLLDRVVTYEVTQPLPVHIGPIGAQIDESDCRLLPGRWSQLEMLVPREERMRYLRVVSVALFQPAPTTLPESGAAR